MIACSSLFRIEIAVIVSLFDLIIVVFGTVGVNAADILVDA